MTRTKQELINIIEDFINGKGGAWDWDDFTSIKLEDNELENIRLICVILPDKFPPIEEKQYCNPEGIKLLERIVFDLKNSNPSAGYGLEKDLREIREKQSSNQIKFFLFISFLILFLIFLLKITVTHNIIL